MAKTHLGLLVVAILAFGMLVASPLLANAQSYQQLVSTNKGTLKIGITMEPQVPKPSGQTKLKIDFLNPQTSAIQEHIDYSVSVTKDSKAVFGPIPLTHTSLGTITIPIHFKENGEHQLTVDVQGILFQPIPSEKAVLTVKVGEQSSVQDTKKSDDKKIDKEKKKTKSDKSSKKIKKAKTNKIKTK